MYSMRNFVRKLFKFLFCLFTLINAMNDVDVYLTNPYLIQNNYNEPVAENQTLLFRICLLSHLFIQASDNEANN